jgi:CheY-like chemotaxis protein
MLQPRAGVEPHTALGIHVLYVDDEPTNLRVGARILAQLGCSCEVLEDGDQVLPRLQDSSAGPPFRAILMDILMQRSDGETVCRELRAAGVDLPIAAVTAMDTTDTQRFFASGFDFVLLKPFRSPDILRVLVDGQALYESRLEVAAAAIQAP